MKRISVKTYILMALIIASIVLAGAIFGMKFGVEHGQTKIFGFAIGLIAFGIFLFPLFLGNFIMFIICMVNGDDSALEHTGLRRFTAIVYLLVFAFLGAFTFYGNVIVEAEYYESISAELPSEFDGFKIAQISDLHNEERGEGNYKILDVLRAEQPDMIAITGDFIDGHERGVEICVDFAKEALKIAPCYYVPGNHEGNVKKYSEFEAALAETGVIIIHNEIVKLEHNGAEIFIAGIDDPRFAITQKKFSKSLGLSKIVAAELDSLDLNDGYTVLLSHRPDYFSLYAKTGADLDLSGHVHGGYFRLPYIGGIAGPGEGLLPDYDAGKFSTGSMDMIVSCGIASSTFPFRFNNPPEVTVTILKAN